MCEVTREIEAKPPLMAALIEIRRTMKALLRELQSPQPEEARGTAPKAGHA